jgi:hypothetical protein
MSVSQEVYECTSCTYRLECAMHLHKEWMIALLNLFQDPSLCHDLKHFVILLDPIFPDNFHSKE